MALKSLKYLPFFRCIYYLCADFLNISIYHVMQKLCRMKSSQAAPSHLGHPNLLYLFMFWGTLWIRNWQNDARGCGYSALFLSSEADSISLDSLFSTKTCTWNIRRIWYTHTPHQGISPALKSQCRVSGRWLFCSVRGRAESWFRVWLCC